MANSWIKHLGGIRKKHPELKNDFKALAAKAKETYKPKPQNGGCEDPTNCSEGGRRGGKNSRKGGFFPHRRRGGKNSRKGGMRGGSEDGADEDAPAPEAEAEAPLDETQDGGESPLETGDAADAPAPEAEAEAAPDADADAQQGGRRRRRRKSSSKRRSHKKSHGRKKSARKSKRKSKRRSRR